MGNYLRNLLVLIFFSISWAMIGQQSSPSSLYMYNKYAHFSAYAGMEGSLFATTNYRSQWQNLEGAPINKEVNIHLPVYYLGGAMGLKIENRLQGPQGITSVNISYNYVYSKSWGILTSGVSLGMFQYRLDGSRLITPDGDYQDGFFNHNDFFLYEKLDNSVGANYGLSVYFINNTLEAGFSFQQFPTYKTRLKEGSFRNATIMKFFVEAPFNIFEDYILRPSIMIQSDLVQTQTDLAMVASYSGNIFGGLGVRGYSNNTLDAVYFIAGWSFNKYYSMVYAFDFGVSGLRNVHQGTHEIQLNYNLNKKIGFGLSPKIIFNPRYM